MELTLCTKCKDNFIEAGKEVKRLNNIKEVCDYCNCRRGFYYEINDEDR